MVTSELLQFSKFSVNMKSSSPELLEKEGRSPSKSRRLIFPTVVSLSGINKAISEARLMLRAKVPTSLRRTVSCHLSLSRTPQPAYEMLMDNAGRELLKLSLECLENGNKVDLSSEGCGGVYFIHNNLGNPIAVFKPRNEEFMTAENPRGYVKSDAIVGKTEHAVNRGFIAGDGALKEAAAYLLDRRNGAFSGVPVTVIAELDIHGLGRKTQGSLQSFVNSKCSAEDIGTMRFDVAQVQKVGILDLRLFNTDRHAANILLTERRGEVCFDMTPIDHGYCLPSWKHLESATFEWLYWPQAKFPFSPTTLAYISSLNPEMDAILLRSLNADEDSITTMRICSHLLQVGAAAGLSLFGIACMMEREGDGSEKSDLEIAVEETAKLIPTAYRSNKKKVGDFLVPLIVQRFKEMVALRPQSKPRSVSCY